MMSELRGRGDAVVSIAEDEVAVKPEDIRCIAVKSDVMDDWWVIERAEHDGRGWLEPTEYGGMSFQCSSRISDADIEGYGVEMLAIADAIEKGERASFKRCAVAPVEGGFKLWSPRNSQRPGVITKERAIDLAADIRKKVTT